MFMFGLDLGICPKTHQLHEKPFSFSPKKTPGGCHHISNSKNPKMMIKDQVNACKKVVDGIAKEYVTLPSEWKKMGAGWSFFIERWSCGFNEIPPGQLNHMDYIIKKESLKSNNSFGGIPVSGSPSLVLEVGSDLKMQMYFQFNIAVGQNSLPCFAVHRF